MSGQRSSESGMSFLREVPPFPLMERDTPAVRLFRQALPAVLESITPPQQQQPSCLVEELIDISTYWLRILSLLVDTVASGNAVLTYAQEQIERLEKEDELRDIQFIEALNEKHRALKHIAASLASSVEDCPDGWDGPNSRRPSPNSLNLNVQGDLYAAGIPAARVPPEIHIPLAPYTGLAVAEASAHASRTAHPMAADEDSSDDQDEDKATPILSRLGTRGRGRYTCPYGWECNKGGVGRHRDLRVFELNSTFRDHLNKHLRPLKCTVLECTNTKGFSKQGNLDRHMRNVHHLGS